MSQFEPRGEGFVYRAGGRGAPVPVTRAEYDAFRRQLAVSFGLHVVALLLGVIAAAMLVSIFFPQGGEAGGLVLMALLLLLIGFGLWHSLNWALHAPARALAGRAAIGPAYDRQDLKARTAALRKAHPWWRLVPSTVPEIGFGLLVAAVWALFGRRSAGAGGFAGAGLWFGAFILVLGLCAMIARRRSERRGDGVPQPETPANAPDAEKIRPGGCALMLLFAVAEIGCAIVGLGVLSGGMPQLSQALGVTGDAMRWTIGIGALVIAVVVDRLSVRWAGGSLGQLLMLLPAV